MATLAEQIQALENARAAKLKQLEDITQKSIDDSRSMTGEEQQSYDELSDEIDSIDADLKRFRDLEKRKAVSAAPVNGSNSKDASSSREHGGYVTVLPKNEPPGIAFAKYARCVAVSKGNLMQALEIARNKYKDDVRIQNIIKADINAGSTLTDSTNWAQALVGDETQVFADFAEYLRPQTVLGRFGNNGIPGLRSVPFRTPLVGQTAGGAGYWVGEGQAKPLTSFDFSRTTIEPLKVANICVLTDELLRSSSPSADLLIRNALADALRERMDTDFVDPTKAAVAGVSPASITNGLVAIASSGTTADNVRTDLKALFEAFLSANNTPTNGVFIMSATMALSLSLLVNALGQQEFPGISMAGGTLQGLPVIPSEYIPTDSSGSIVILVNASDVYLGDEGGVNIDISNQASLEMSDAPGADSITPTAQTQKVVSLWQTNSVGIRAERIINWALRRTSAAAYLSGVDWGG